MRPTTFIKVFINDALVHSLRDIHDLKEKYPNDERLLNWVLAVKAIYDEAVAWLEQGPDPNTSYTRQVKGKRGNFGRGGDKKKLL